MIPIEVEEWHDSISADLEIVKSRVAGAVRRFCENNGFAYYGRPKTLESLCEKLETGRVSSIQEIDDLFACSIIISSLREEPEVLESLTTMFDCHALRLRTDTDKPPDVFRFEATRFIGRLKVPDPDEEHLSKILFEIQVRTAFEHAWSVSTHGAAYKAGTVNWGMERLAAQMKALVEQLDSLAFDYSGAAETLVKHPHYRTEAEKTIFEAFQRFERDGLIPQEIAPAKWGLFAKNVVCLAEAADWGKWIRLDERIGMILEVIERELHNAKQPTVAYSVSLFQLTFGILIESGAIKTTFRKENYSPPITQSLEQLFPKTRDVQQRCTIPDAD